MKRYRTIENMFFVIFVIVNQVLCKYYIKTLSLSYFNKNTFGICHTASYIMVTPC